MACYGSESIKGRVADGMKCMHMISRDRDHSEGWGEGQLPFGTFPKIHAIWYTLNPEITILYQFHAQKALFKVPEICDISFWIENDPPPPWNFSENSSVLEGECVPKGTPHRQKIFFLSM